MYKKLLKYDLRFLFRRTSLYFLIVFIASLIARLVNLLPTNVTLIKVGVNAYNFLFIASLVVFPFYAFATIVGRYRKNMLSDEGYLTHTLPVKESKILLSKLSSSLILMFSVVILIIVTSIIAYANGNVLVLIGDIFESIFDLLFNISSGWVLLYTILIIILLIFSLVVATIIVPLAQTISTLFEDKRSIMTVIFIIVIITAIDLITTIVTTIMSVSFSNFITTQSGIAVMLGVCCLLECLIIIGMYYLILLIIKKRLNLK